MQVRMIAAAMLTVASAQLAARSAETPPVGCSWPAKIDADTLNTAFPDESATYWATRFVSIPGARLEIHGTYPAARYFSFHAYDELQRPVGSLADREIAPDAGSVNPFVTPGAEAGGSYSAFVEFTAKPAAPAPNTLHAGATAEGIPNPAGFILMRVYTPDDPADPAGGVPLPLVTVVLPGDIRVPFAACEPLPPSTGGAVTQAIREASFPDAVPPVIPFVPTESTPEFRRFFGLDRNVWDRVPPNPVTDPIPRFQGGFLSNQHIAYLYRILSREFGDVFVLRAKAPMFPDTRAGDDPTEPTQVRYWSICENELATQRFVACLADHQSVVDEDGFMTFVISDPDDRPANAQNWIPWGGIFYDGLVIYRHMLPAAPFA
ncbi:MAG: hypothetical protein ACRDKS_02130, partial [Actinomycetota bacterium]